MGFHFQGRFYFDKSSCHFEAPSTFLHWVLSESYPAGGFLHYLDDFLCVGPPHSTTCQEFDNFINICNTFGVPLVQEKTVFPTTTIEFFGITIDSSLIDFRSPIEKLQTITALLSVAVFKRKVFLKEVTIVSLYFCSHSYPSSQNTF